LIFFAMRIEQITIIFAISAGATTALAQPKTCVSISSEAQQEKFIGGTCICGPPMTECFTTYQHLREDDQINQKIEAVRATPNNLKLRRSLDKMVYDKASGMCFVVYPSKSKLQADIDDGTKSSYEKINAMEKLEKELSQCETPATGSASHPPSAK
jgi:hypothetical protein